MIVFQLAGSFRESSLTSRNSTVYCGRYIIQGDLPSGGPALMVTNGSIFYQLKRNLATLTWCLPARFTLFLQSVIARDVRWNNLYEAWVSCQPEPPGRAKPKSPSSVTQLHPYLPRYVHAKLCFHWKIDAWFVILIQGCLWVNHPVPYEAWSQYFHTKFFLNMFCIWWLFYAVPVNVFLL
jgi:hypothetical protein